MTTTLTTDASEVEAVGSAGTDCNLVSLGLG